VRLLIGTDSEYAAVIRAANEMHRADERSPLLVLLGGAGSFSFKPRPSTILVPGIPAGVIAAIPALEEFGIASRLASDIGLPGCYDGTVVELADAWFQGLDASLRSQVTVAVRGPEDLARAARDLGRRLGVPVQVVPG
jgi:hypothetical protein